VVAVAASRLSGPITNTVIPAAAVCGGSVQHRVYVVTRIDPTAAASGVASGVFVPASGGSFWGSGFAASGA
jgi:hypothetical protein